MSANILDITDLKQKGKELVKYISDTVNNKDLFIIQSIPSKIKMDQRQYDSINKASLFLSYGFREPDVETKFQVFLTEQINGVFTKSGGYLLEVEVG